VTTQTLSRAQARRIALGAQGFLDPVHASPTMRTLARTVARTGVLQVDSVNVLARAHLMPLYSRMGPYDPSLLERAASGREQRRLVEYWAHVQALMPVELWPHLRFRMETYRAQRGKWGFTADPTLEPAVLDAVRQRGPVTARDLDAEFSGPRTKEHWGWNWSEARKVLDYLFLVGDVAIAGRTRQFEVRGRRNAMLDDSDVHWHRQIKAAVGGVTAAVTGDPAVFVSVSAAHQGPEGGGPVAAIVDLG
jgi:uncharacterized protein YcaQ